jgi:hypothetical protein
MRSENGSVILCANSISTHPSPSAILCAGFLSQRTFLGEKQKNQAAAVSATGAGFLVTSFSTIGDRVAPTLRQ